ncbi:MAG TPA: hypothetical protein VIV12_26230 [Streptosporangiaceae bacterium]
MADNVGSGAVAGLPPESGEVSATPAGAVTPQPFHGRAVSWVAVSIIMVAFLVGGVGLIIGPAWWLFWTGVGIATVGALLALATDIFEDWY